MQIDSGSDAALQLPPSSAAAFAIEPGVETPNVTLLQGKRDIAMPTVGRVREMVIEGNIGMPVLRNWVMTFDIQRERLWISRAAPGSGSNPVP